MNGSRSAAPASRLTTLIAVMRDNENFQIGATVVLIIMTIAGLILQGSDYAAHIHSPLAFLGALAGLGIPLAAVTLLALTYPGRRRGRWLIAAASTVLVTLFLALLPPVTAGHGWLAVLLTVLVTLTYDVVAIAYLLVLRPWAWISGMPE
jgi:hypothetical protein